MVTVSAITHMEVDVAIIGGGPAGIAAAVAADKQGVSVLIIERDHELGGILQQCIHNGFGLRYFKQELTGPEYAQRFIDKLENTKVKTLCNTTVLELAGDREITAINSHDGIVKVKAKAVVLAMGCRERTRGAINVPGTRPAGVYPAGQAQRLMNMEGYIPGKRIVILGSGDIGMIMARRCMLEGLQVLCVVEVLPYGTGLVRNQVQCLQEFNIPLYLKHTISDIRGKERVEGVTVSEIDDRMNPIPGTEVKYDCDTVLFSVGLIPENEISRDAGCKISGNGGPAVNEFCETTVPGIFASGNVLQVHDLVDWVSLESERAGESAAKFAKGELTTHAGETRTLKPGNNVGYVKPERIDNFTTDKTVEISFRVRSPRQNQRTEILSDGKVIYSRKHKHIIPSEMIILKPTLKPSELGKELVINVVDDEPAHCGGATID